MLAVLPVRQPGDLGQRPTALRTGLPAGVPFRREYLLGNAMDRRNAGAPTGTPGTPTVKPA